MNMNNNVYSCPFCDGNGAIYRAKIKDTDIIIYICDECDTVWKSLDIREETCERFDDLMNSLGREESWSELEEVELVKKYK